ncbi:MBOAT family protein, partial [Patescibacteria group bacterium]|nr:MBOAT family protein [Patescibacteria group bacterium]
MTFTSIAFVIFIILITFFYYISPAKFRWLILLIGSCYFYMAFVPKYILILFVLIIIDYVLAQKIESSLGTKRKIFFIGSLVSNIGLLFVFKYFNFFNENILNLAHLLHWNYSIGTLSLILPLGLSFHTFQSMSYIIEVYRGNYKAEKHLGIYALYVLFFPQLVAGPIERPEHLLPQLKKDIPFEFSNIVIGLRLMLWGFFKKLVVADRLAISVTYVYAHISNVSGLSIVITIIFFAFQLYADFSGYSDIARGSAKLLGIDVIRNFNQPYFSKSVAEFWRRWHISLSSWFRDYFYFPLVYSRKQTTR